MQKMPSCRALRLVAMLGTSVPLGAQPQADPSDPRTQVLPQVHRSSLQRNGVLIGTLELLADARLQIAAVATAEAAGGHCTEGFYP